MLGKVAGTAAVAGLSFLAGKYSNDDFSIFRNVQSATNVPMNQIQLPATTETALKPSSLNPDALGPSRSAEIMKHGYPGFTNVRTYEDFVLSYDYKTKTAHWVCEHLTPERLKHAEGVDRKLCEFKPDVTFPQKFLSQNTDYKASGFDRGHLAAAGNHRKSQLAVDQTFYLSNMSPQVGRGFNRDKWNDLEMHCRRVAKKMLNTHIITGPLYLPKLDSDGKKYIKYQVIGDNNVAVPTHFFKVALFEVTPGKYELESYILPNAVIEDTVEISTFHVPLDAVERSAGLELFTRIDPKSITKVNGVKKGGLLW
ncbi:CBN-CPS-6 protein [Caenorhabditis brenneri]|uniref:Endonuclease n=1 Tax=Caenorhabditis brenneri TaxID=135651 RepID=G0NLF2_CAEBE|nr:CBN-CPS-6 protein [Caenorhabditis brenneri]